MRQFGKQNMATYLLVSFGFVVQMILVVGFVGNAVKFFQKPLAPVLVPFCMDDRFTREFLECSQKSLFSSGLTYL